MLRALLHYSRATRESVTEAERLLRNAIEIDPAYGPAMARLPRAIGLWCHRIGWTGLTPPLGRWSNWQEPHWRWMAPIRSWRSPMLYHTSLIIALPGGDLSGGIALINRSIELNPNSASALQMAGLLHAFAGDKQLPLPNSTIRLALSCSLERLLSSISAYALAHFVAGEFEAAVEWTSKALQQFPNDTSSLRFRAASLGLLGRLEEGRQVVQRLLALVPDFTIARARRHIEFDMNNVFKTPGVADALYEGLRRGGVPSELDPQMPGQRHVLGVGHPAGEGPGPVAHRLGLRTAPDADQDAVARGEEMG